MHAEVLSGLLSELENLGRPKGEQLPRGQAHPNCVPVAAVDEVAAAAAAKAQDGISDLAFDFSGMLPFLAHERYGGGGEGVDEAAAAAAAAEGRAAAADAYDAKERGQLTTAIGSVLKEVWVWESGFGCG